ncbi:oxidoreductase [Thiocystis violacea]|uniref:oxidoreductase n=1 Tax=Thiocystis violacea TaxID=13725 RepID=UPI0019086DBA|nr:oxidoreductase [Thiocystis violacea]MBK1718289.1 oxidoreductase [Thiocystis violacea]
MSQVTTYIGPTATAVIKSSQRVTPETTDEVRHITLEVLDPAFQFVEGQSIGVLVPGPHDFGNQDHLRRYSIANARSIPVGTGVSLEILVRRCFYIDEVSGERYPGVASNYLCDAKLGDRITVSGPYLSPFRMPLDNRANLLMIGTGTGIAPFRAFAQLIYERRGDWKGQVRLYYGGHSGLDLMYANDETSDLAHYYDEKTFQAFRALGTKPLMTSSEALEQGLVDHAADSSRLMREPNTHVFLSGLSKVTQVFDKVMAKQAGSEADWKQLKLRMIEEGRWSEMIYD